jgi:hypothetical protein
VIIDRSGRFGTESREGRDEDFAFAFALLLLELNLGIGRGGNTVVCMRAPRV